MMVKKILAGYSSILVAAVRFLALMAACIGAGFLVVWPLWKLADADPGIYTIAFTILALTIIIFLVADRIRHSFALNRRRFLISLLRKLVILAGIIIPVTLVLSWHRLAAALVLLAAIAAYGYLAFALDPEKRPGAEKPAKK